MTDISLRKLLAGHHCLTSNWDAGSSSRQEIEKAQILSQLIARTQELEEMRRGSVMSAPLTPLTPWFSPARGMSKKSDLPGTIDPEMAILAGAATTFQPLSGRLMSVIPRGRIYVRLEEGLLRILSLYGNSADRSTVLLYKRPGARGVLFLYFLIIHIVWILGRFHF